MRLLRQKNLCSFGVRAANFSGITHIGGNLYAVVDDKEITDGFFFLNIDIDTRTGKICDVRYSEPEGFINRRNTVSESLSTYRDCEAIAYCKQSNTVFIAGEKDQRILEYDMLGNPTGRELHVPEYMKMQNIVRNYGFEALAYNEKEEVFWTTTEATLKSDGLRSSIKNNYVSNCLRILSFDRNLRPSKMYGYIMDKMEAKVKVGNHVHGVSAVLAMDDGRLIIMEREACIKKWYMGSFCHIKLYEINPEQGQALPADVVLSELEEKEFLEKKLLCEFTTHVSVLLNFANFEGMCLGPKLDDGRQTIILISDSQGGYGNVIYRLRDWIKVIILD